MVKLPKKIHFGGRNYTVEMVSELDGEESWGRTDMKRQKIFIEEKMPLEHQMEILIHELLHIAWRHTFSNFKGEEEKVKAWSMNIYGILKDNNFLK